MRRSTLLALLILNAIPQALAVSPENKPTTAEALRQCYHALTSALPPPIRNRVDYYARMGFRKVLGRRLTEWRGNIWKPDLVPLLPKEPTIIEAGAHLGYDTVEMKQIWPNAQIYAFEPIPSVFTQLVDNTRSLPGVHTLPLALGPKNGSTLMYVSDGSSTGSSSILPPLEHLTLFPNVGFSERVQVNVVNLQDWAFSHGIQSVDLLWLDLQGYEFDAIRNARELLAQTRLIYAEVNLVETYGGAVLYPKLLSWLAQQGFAVEREFRFADGQGNVLFRNTALRPHPKGNSTTKVVPNPGSLDTRMEPP